MRRRAPVFLARLGPGVRAIASAAYRTIASHRRPRGLARLLGSSVPRGRFWTVLSHPGLARRGLGVIYMIAFASLRAQVLGLYGEKGIVPIRRTLERAKGAGDDPGSTPRLGRWRKLPTLLWRDPSDAALKRLSQVGQVAGAALALGFVPRLAAAVAWGAYLSFVSVGPPFLFFQWDTLLLEAGFLAMLGRPRRLLTRFLALRLQLESGVAKLASRDPTWRDLSACCHHQQTQPLPTRVRLVRAPPAATRAAIRHGADVARRVRRPAARARPAPPAPDGARRPDRLSRAHRPHGQLRLLQLADGRS